MKNVLLWVGLIVSLIGIEFDMAFADTIANVSNYTELASALDCNCGAAYFVYFTSDILYPPNNASAPETLYAIRYPVTVDGQGHTLTVERAYYNSTNTWNPAILFDIRADNVTVRNLTVNFSGIAFYIDAKGVSSDENYSWFGGKLVPSENVVIEDVDVESQGEYGFFLHEMNNTVFRNLVIRSRDRAVRIAESKNVTLENMTFIASSKYDLMHYFVDGLLEHNLTYSLGKIASATDGWINLADFVVNASVLNKSVSIGTFDISATVSGAMTTVRLKYNKTLAQKLSINESTISIYRRNSTSDWNKLPSMVNINESYVEANVTSFSPFAIAGELLDTDGDGITDDTDVCPSEPENYNGYDDGDGCPDTPPSISISGGGGGGSYSPPTRELTVVVANGIDRDLAEPYLPLLWEYVVYHPSVYGSKEMNKLIFEARRVIMLGGPEALEGMGEVSRQFNPTVGIITKTTHGFVHNWWPWKREVLVFAGRNREETRDLFKTWVESGGL